MHGWSGFQEGCTEMVSGFDNSKLSVCLAGIPLKNPIMTASGTFGFGKEASTLYDINKLGAVVIKGVTKEPRLGNPLPRITDCPSGLLNSIGLENPGIYSVIAHELPALRQLYDHVIVSNVCGFSIDEFEDVASQFDASPYVAMHEVNISCPNVKHGGMVFGVDPNAAAAITRAIKLVTKKPIFIKLSPNVTDIVSIAKACEAEGADGLTLINTILGMRINLRTKKPILGNVFGGLSGPAVLPVALRMIFQVYEAVKIPIIGVGGVSSARDVVEMMLAGATAVQVGSANLVDCHTCTNIIDMLPDIMAELGVINISDIIGAAH